MAHFQSLISWPETCTSNAVILLITPSARAQDCAKAIQEATAESAQVAATLRQAATQLRAQEYSAVVIDQSLLEAEPDESEMLLQHIGMAIPVHVKTSPLAEW